MVLWQVRKVTWSKITKNFRASPRDLPQVQQRGVERSANPDFIVISERYKIFPFGSIACESEMWSKDSYKQGLPDSSELTD